MPAKIILSSCFSSTVLLLDVFVDFVKLILLSTFYGSFKESTILSDKLFIFVSLLFYLLTLSLELLLLFLKE